MSMEWMMPRGRGAKPAFLKQWEENACKVANYPPTALAKVGDVAVKVIASTENLEHAWDYAARHGGQAAGPNDKTFSDFSRVGVWSEIERLRDELIAGLTADLIAAKSPKQAYELRRKAYRHGAVRKARVPKRPGSIGTRPLAIPNVQDRVVGRAQVQILEPLFRPRFDDRSYCRPTRGAWQALAHAQLIAEREDRWIWIAEDIVGAFAHVPLSRLLDVVYSYIPSNNLLDLIRRSMGEHRQKGLWQGAPLSSLLMNIYLDALLDRRWRLLHPNVPLLRYMDDILILCRVGDDVVKLYRDLASLIEEAALELKHGFEAARHAIREREVTWLGYRLRMSDDGLAYRLPFDGSDQVAKDWQRYLGERFKELHKVAHAPEAAIETVYGIVAGAGPTLSWTDSRAVYEIIRRSASSAAFEEIPSYHTVRQRWENSHAAWLRCCDLAANPPAPNVPTEEKGLTWDDHHPPF